MVEERYHPTLHAANERPPDVRRRTADLHARVNGDLQLEFANVALTSYAGLELFARYLRRTDFNAVSGTDWENVELILKTIWLRELVAFTWSALDHIFEEDEEVRVHARIPAGSATRRPIASAMSRISFINRSNCSG